MKMNFWPRSSESTRSHTEPGLAIGTAGRSRLADLLQESALGREFQDLMICRIVAGQPDVAGDVHDNAVLPLRPLVAIARSAPCAQQVAFGVEREHRGR